jgi:hypothetical protein
MCLIGIKGANSCVDNDNGLDIIATKNTSHVKFFTDNNPSNVFGDEID